MAKITEEEIAEIKERESAQDKAEAQKAEAIKLAEEETENIAKAAKKKMSGDDKVAQFIFSTLQQNSTTYVGPSGFKYVIYKGQPFKVRSKQDVEFFKKNKRFEKKGFFDRAGPKMDVDEDLAGELDKIKGLTEKTKDIVIKKYLSKANLEDEIFQGYKLDPNIGILQTRKLKKHFEKK